MSGTDTQAAAKGLIRSLPDGGVAALARTITVLCDPNTSSEVAGLVPARTDNTKVIGFTGPPGSGKSTLICELVSRLRSCGKNVAVLAVDPSSKLTGGAFLGDRARMNVHGDDQGVFIRSLASRGNSGGLADRMVSIISAVSAAQWPIVIVETVGVGQLDTDVFEVVDHCVVVNTPGFGDEVQALKAGLLEVGDLFVINKADQPGADKAKRELEKMLHYREGRDPILPVLAVSAISGAGVSELEKVLGIGRESVGN